MNNENLGINLNYTEMFLISILTYYFKLFFWKRRLWIAVNLPRWLVDLIYDNLFYSQKCIWCRVDKAHVEKPKEDWTCSIPCTMLYRACGPRDLLPRDKHGNIMIPPFSEYGKWKQDWPKNN